MPSKMQIEEKEINIGAASNKVAAAIDVQRNSNRYMLTYTPAQAKPAWDAYAQIIDAYSFAQNYVTFRKDDIVIKITKPRARSIIAVEIMEQDFAKKGFSKVVTPQGILYHIPKKAGAH